MFKPSYGSLWPPNIPTTHLYPSFSFFWIRVLWWGLFNRLQVEMTCVTSRSRQLRTNRPFSFLSSSKMRNFISDQWSFYLYQGLSWWENKSYNLHLLLSYQGIFSGNDFPHQLNLKLYWNQWMSEWMNEWIYNASLQNFKFLRLTAKLKCQNQLLSLQQCHSCSIFLLIISIKATLILSLLNHSNSIT